MKEAECEYYNEQFDLRKYNMKQIWRNLNQACSISTTKENKGITKLSDNRKNITDNLLTSNVLNKYFVTVGKNLSKKLPVKPVEEIWRKKSLRISNTM